jgi:hypothetical protein
LEIASLVVTSVIALIGLWLAHDLRRQQRLKIADQRIVAYQELWKLMELARPTRLDRTVDKGGPLTRDEAARLYRKMTNWYYDSGNGMLLPNETKALYLEAKRRLGAYADDSRAKRVPEGARRIQELSLLRTQMKRDLDIYGINYSGALEPEDKEFISAAELDPEGWDAAYWHRELAARWRASARARLSKLARRERKKTDQEPKTEELRTTTAAGADTAATPARRRRGRRT